MPFRVLSLCLFITAMLLAFPAYSSDEALPSEELLEFLAEFETNDGEWVNPAELEDMEIPEQEQPKDAY